MIQKFDQSNTRSLDFSMTKCSSLIFLLRAVLIW